MYGCGGSQRRNRRPWVLHYVNSYQIVNIDLRNRTSGDPSNRDSGSPCRPVAAQESAGRAATGYHRLRRAPAAMFHWSNNKRSSSLLLSSLEVLMGRDPQRGTPRKDHSQAQPVEPKDEFSFIHAADVHLDSPLIGLERYGDAPVDDLRGATRRAFQALVDTAIDEGVAFVLLAGDLYDGDWKDYNTGLFFAQQMTRLADAGINVFVVSGNHDAANQFTKSLRTPSNVTRFSTSHAETRRLPGLQVAIHGRGFAAREITEDLSSTFPTNVPGWLNIGLLHTSLDGRPGHAVYAPCSVDGLLARKYDYWALGHVHAREIVREDPWIVFPGNVQGRHARETGAKGCTIVKVVDGSIRELREIQLDVVRWHHWQVDLSGTTTSEEAMASIAAEMRACVDTADGRMVALRLTLCGRTGVHRLLMAHPEHFTQEIRSLAIDSCGDRSGWRKSGFRPKGPPPWFREVAMTSPRRPLSALFRNSRPTRSSLPSFPASSRTFGQSCRTTSSAPMLLRPLTPLRQRCSRASSLKLESCCLLVSLPERGEQCASRN